MNEMVASLGEDGFDAVRFGGGVPAPEECRLVDVLPLLVRVEHKSKLGLGDLPKAQLDRIIEVCAGMAVRTRMSTALKTSIRVVLKECEVEISQDAAGGLRDVIFAAVLLRMFHDESCRGLCFRDLIEEARMTLLDELPHAMGYSGARELECTLMEGDSVVLKTHFHEDSCALPLPEHEKVIEHREIVMRAA